MAILGGTFDPPHKAHVAVALEACEKAGMDKIVFLPCHIPALKSSPKVTPTQRLNMLQLVVEEHPGIDIDGRELLSDTTSYSVNTLEALKAEDPDTTLFFIIGTDNLIMFEKWHRWQDILELCHLIVCRRSDKDDTPFETLHQDIKRRLIDHIEPCHNASAGYIYLADTKLSDISSTEIRLALAQGRDASTWLEPKVYDYIKQHGLYQGTPNTC
ncbi:MAG: nicotinate-nucleotide adenylyltransferase [Pseudomonadota bacterium]